MSHHCGFSMYTSVLHYRIVEFNVKIITHSQNTENIIITKKIIIDDTTF